jgi:hypothetical protein
LIGWKNSGTPLILAGNFKKAFDGGFGGDIEENENRALSSAAFVGSREA